MGNTFTILGRHTLKKVRRFNVQTRTEKYLERHKDKPERAPLYDATMKEVEKIMKELPDMTEEIKKKDGTLLNNLRKVYVTSTGDNKDSFSTKRVDASREAKFSEAITVKQEVLPDVPAGKYTMDQALTMITQYQTNPMMNSPNALATKFNLEPSVIAKITKHVKILDYFDTTKKETKHELIMKDLLPRSFQGKSEWELMDEMENEAMRRSKLLFERAAKLRASKDEILIESDLPGENLLSKETATQIEQIYVDLEIYRKTGKLPTGPKLIEGRQIDNLSIEDIKKLPSTEDSSAELTENSDEESDKKIKKLPSTEDSSAELIENSDKESDKKDVSEDKHKAAN